MNNILTALWSITIFITLIGFIPYVIWLIYTVVKKQWKLLGLRIGIPVVIFLLLLGFSAISNIGDYGRYLEGLFDTKVELGDPIFEYKSERSFNGDGYSITMYDLPPAIRSRFGSVDEKLLAEFPKHPSYRDHWNFERWRKGPFDEAFNDYLDFALSSYDARNAPELTEHFDAIRAALKREETFYAFFYSRPSPRLGDVDFFIVDLIEGRLYLINHNT